MENGQLTIMGVIYYILIFAIVSAYYDRGKRFTNHIPRALFRLGVCVLIGWFDVMYVMLGLSVFYLVFDYALNCFEGRNIGYIGGTAYTDRIMRRIGPLNQLILKLGFVTNTIIIT